MASATARRLLTVVILITLGLQGLYTTLPTLHAVARVTAGSPPGALVESLVRFLIPPTLFPFLDYPMYSRPRYPGEGVRRDVVIATLADRTEVRVRPEDLNLGHWLFTANVVGAIRDGDHGRIQGVVDVLETRHAQPVTELRLENHPLIIDRDGQRDGTPVIEAVFPLDLEGSEP